VDVLAASFLDGVNLIVIMCYFREYSEMFSNVRILNCKNWMSFALQGEHLVVFQVGSNVLVARFLYGVDLIGIIGRELAHV
jgi:hypothetical protein